MPDGNLPRLYSFEKCANVIAGLVPGLSGCGKRSDRELLRGRSTVLEGNSYAELEGGSQDGFRNMFEETAIHRCAPLRRSIWKELQIRNISAIQPEKDAIYFLPPEEKNFCRELLEDGRVQISGYSKYKEMIRLSSRRNRPQKRTKKWMDLIFAEQPYLANVYPGKTRDIGIIFEPRRSDRVFSSGSLPRFSGKRIYWDVESNEQENARGSQVRRRCEPGKRRVRMKGYRITDACIGVEYARKLSAKMLEPGVPYRIRPEHCPALWKLL